MAKPSKTRNRESPLMSASDPALNRSRLQKLFRLGAFLLPLALAACVSTSQPPEQNLRPRIDPTYAAMYGPRPDERFALPATDISEVDPQFLRREVAYQGREEPGTIVVDTDARFLYLVRENGRAMRYGIGVGNEGLAWSGRARVGRKAEWPRWTPTADMIRREPERNRPWAGGMEGGLRNPLGARALYLYDGGRDTMYRIHGTTEPWSIGRAVSSGCIRMFNQDVIDLYNRVPVGSPVVVLNGNRRFFNEPEEEVAELPRVIWR
jgi:lipoprotein-anchoring transpeptidase ErfK/SrfK